MTEPERRFKPIFVTPEEREQNKRDEGELNKQEIRFKPIFVTPEERKWREENGFYPRNKDDAIIQLETARLNKQIKEDKAAIIQMETRLNAAKETAAVQTGNSEKRKHCTWLRRK